LQKNEEPMDTYCKHVRFFQRGVSYSGNPSRVIFVSEGGPQPVCVFCLEESDPSAAEPARKPARLQWQQVSELIADVATLGSEVRRLKLQNEVLQRECAALRAAVSAMPSPSQTQIRVLPLGEASPGLVSSPEVVLEAASGETKANGKKRHHNIVHRRPHALSTPA
jgi:hypothetical protein